MLICADSDEALQIGIRCLCPKFPPAPCRPRHCLQNTKKLQLRCSDQRLGLLLKIRQLQTMNFALKSESKKMKILICKTSLSSKIPHEKYPLICCLLNDKAKG